MALAMLACKAETAPKLVLLLLLLVLVVCGLLTLVSCMTGSVHTAGLNIPGLCLHKMITKAKVDCANAEWRSTEHACVLHICNGFDQKVLSVRPEMCSDVQDAERLELLLTWMEEEPVMGSIFFLESFLERTP